VEELQEAVYTVYGFNHCLTLKLQEQLENELIKEIINIMGLRSTRDSYP